MVEKLEVYIWGIKAGTLVSYEEHYKDKACFYFDEDFIEKGYDLAPLRAPLKSIASMRGLPIYAEEDKIFGGLPSFIADSLPDHWGNKVLTKWAKSNNINVKKLSCLDRLAYIGRRGMGALEFLPPRFEDMEKSFVVEIDELFKLSQSILNEAKNFKTDLASTLMIESLFKVGTSAGGRRPKAVINLNPQTGECYSGQVSSPQAGFIPMIIKFDEHSEIPSTRIEYSYYLMAKDAGLQMMPSQLLEGDTSAHFLTERFDRKGDKKIHTQSLCAMKPGANSYEDLFDVACRIGIAPSELEHLFLQCVMNVLSGNVDDHSKNFSFLMDRDGVWHASPAYDFTFSVDTSAPEYVNRHNLSINNKNYDILQEDLCFLGKFFNIKKIDSIIDKAIGIVSNYEAYAQKAGVSDYWIEKIKEEISYRVTNCVK